MSHQSIFEDCWEDAETRVAGLEDHLRLERVVDERFRVVGDEPGQPRTFFARDVQDGAEVTLRLGLDGLEEERDRAEVQRDRSDFERACVALLEVAGGPHLPEVVQAGCCARFGPYLAYRRIAGPTLAEALRVDGPLRGPELRFLVDGLIDALRRVHGGGWVHAGIRPAHVVLRDGWEPVLVGFHSALPAGTELRDGPVDARADVFALAATLWAAATGRSPLIDEHGPALDADMPMSFGLALMGALELDPAKRPRDMRLFGAQLRGALREDARHRRSGQVDVRGVRARLAERANEVA